jgi:hypothetical protein
MVHGAWCMVHGAWCMVHGAWCMVHGAKKIEVCHFAMTNLYFFKVYMTFS